MKSVFVSFIVTASMSAGLASSAAANALECQDQCHEEDRCQYEAYPCGQNEDGSAIMCLREKCRKVLVCEEVCTRPLPDVPDLPDFPDFPPVDPLPF